jgi:hypothetical protein
MEIVILGTSSGKTSRNRGCTSYLVKLGMWLKEGSRFSEFLNI